VQFDITSKFFEPLIVKIREDRLMDPLKVDILNLLENSQLDDQEFERVAAEVHEDKDWISYWIPGGGDFGEDGILINKDHESIPLITTISDRGPQNLKRNVNRLISSGWKGKKVAFATSKRLSPLKRRNIKDFLETKGIKAVGLFDSTWYAERLIRYPHLCKSLLGVTLDYPALHPLPKNPRFSDVPHTIGRDDEIQKVLSFYNEKKDFLVTGQPGYGKTHLLRELAKLGDAYFVITDDLNVISSEVRKYRPKFLLIDDAHTKLELIKDLLSLRKRLGADFLLGLDTWPNEGSTLAQTIGLPFENILKLEPLSLDKILEIIKELGINHYHNWVIQMILNQCCGRPGLAVFLCNQFKNGYANEVVFGQAYLNKLKLDNKDTHAIEILSIIALGGEEGIDLTLLSKTLNEPILKIKKLLSSLASAGVITEHKEGFISVTPDLLRFNLIKEKFFEESPRLNTELFESIPKNRNTLYEGLVGAERVGAKIGAYKLYSLISNSSSDEVMKSFAFLGEQYSSLLLKERPELISSIPEPCLRNCPDTALPLLFKEASKREYSRRNNTTPFPYKVISEWLLEFDALTTEGNQLTKKDILYRRHLFLTKAKKWLQEGKDSNVIENLIPNVLAISWSSTEQEPGLGRTISLKSGLLPVTVIRKIPSFWKDVLKLYKDGLTKNPLHLLTSIDELTHHRRGPVKMPEDFRFELKTMKEKFLKDLCLIAKDCEDDGFKRRLSNKLDLLKIPHSIIVSEDFHILYPPDTERYELEDEKAKEEVEKLAKIYSEKSSEKICKRFKEITTKAKEANLTWPDRSRFLCFELAKLVDNPLDWCLSLTEFDLEPGYLEPFFVKMLNLKPESWDKFVKAVLDHNSRYRTNALIQLFFTEGIDDEMWHLIENSIVDDDSKWISEFLTFNNYPTENAKRMLNHPLASIRGAFACSMWERREKRPKNNELKELWEQAILDFQQPTRVLKEILISEPNLSFKWITKNALSERRFGYEKEQLIISALSKLTIEQRSKLLKKVPFSVDNKSLICSIIKKDFDLYNILVKSDADDYVKSAPLEGLISEDWLRMAIIAFDSGLNEEEIFYGTLLNHFGWSGSEADYWKGRLENYNTYTNYHDDRIAKVSNRLYQYAHSCWERAQDRQKREEVYGRY
jgi:hypothetical protein